MAAPLGQAGGGDKPSLPYPTSPRWAESWCRAPGQGVHAAQTVGARRACSLQLRSSQGRPREPRTPSLNFKVTCDEERGRARNPALTSASRVLRDVSAPMQTTRLVTRETGYFGMTRVGLGNSGYLRLPL